MSDSEGQSIEDKERLISAVPIVIQKDSVGVIKTVQEQDTKKQERIVGVTGGQYINIRTGETEPRDDTKNMTMKYDSDTKQITLSDIDYDCQIDLEKVGVETTKPENHHILIHLPDDYVMTRRPAKPAPTKSGNKSVTKPVTNPNRSTKSMTKIFGDMRLGGGKKYKKSMKNKRKTKKHKSRRYRKIK